jgi:hypothetical protein
MPVVHDSLVQGFIFLLRLVEPVLVLNFQLLLLAYDHIENVEVLLVKLVNCLLSIFFKLLLTLFQHCHFFLVVMGGLLCF